VAALKIQMIRTLKVKQKTFGVIARGILDARAGYPECSPVDLYAEALFTSEPPLSW